MSVSVHILYAADAPEFALEVAASIEKMGGQATVGPHLAACAVLVVDGDPPVPADALLEWGVCTLPTGRWKQAPMAVQRVAATAMALARSAGAATPLSDLDLSEDLDIIQLTLESFDENTPLDSTCMVLAAATDRAQDHARGGRAARELYVFAARALLDQLDAVRSEEQPLAEALAEEVSIALDEVHGGGPLECLAHCYERILLARETARAVNKIDLVFDDLTAAGRALDPPLIHNLVEFGFAEGQPFEEAGSDLGRAQIYLRLAHRLLAARPTLKSQAEALTRDQLAQFAEDGHLRIREDPAGLAHALKDALQTISDAAAQERGWSHDS